MYSIETIIQDIVDRSDLSDNEKLNYYNGWICIVYDALDFIPVIIVNLVFFNDFMNISSEKTRPFRDEMNRWLFDGRFGISPFRTVVYKI